MSKPHEVCRRLQEDRVYVFLDGLDDRLDKIKSDVLQIKLFPIVEQAYAYVQREDTRQDGESIESYYNTLQGLWRKIDFWCLNPMKCTEDIQIYNSNIQKDRVYIFLDGLDDRLDKIRSDVLQIKLFPIVEQAYAHVRREDTHQAVVLSNTESTSSPILLLKGFKIQQPNI